MSTRIAFVSAVLVAVATAGAYSQPRPERPAPPRPVGPPIPVADPPPPATRLDFAPPQPPPPPSVDQLLDALERVQVQKAQLEKQEQELKAAIRKRLDEQNERLKKLGIAPRAAKETELDRVGRIVIVGNVKTPDKKILDKFELHPGQILQYPKLDEARARLEKAGFRGATVEVISNEFDETFKDIKITIAESGR